MTLSETDGARFFGLDLHRWRGQWQAAGALLLDAPLLRRLVPQLTVELHRAGAPVRTWLMARGEARPVAVGGARPADGAIAALELPTDRVLERSLMLPALAPADIDQAVRLDVASTSPFAPGQTVYGHAVQRADGERVQVDVAIASRPQVEQALRAAGFDPASPPEVWVLPVRAEAAAPTRPIVLRGFGEGTRERLAHRGLVRRAVLLGVLLAAMAALVVTPTALIRARAQQADRSFAALQQQAAPQLAEREALMQQFERLQRVERLLGQQLALPPVLDLLTRTLPDGAWLTALRVEGNKLVLNGQADDAAALVQSLAAQPGAHEVRLASPATRRAGAAKETFIIELRLDAQRYGLAHRDQGGAAS